MKHFRADRLPHDSYIKKAFAEQLDELMPAAEAARQRMIERQTKANPPTSSAEARQRMIDRGKR